MYDVVCVQCTVFHIIISNIKPISSSMYLYSHYPLLNFHKLRSSDHNEYLGIPNCIFSLKGDQANTILIVSHFSPLTSILSLIIN